MKYRAKSPARVIEELDDLHRCYGAVHFRFSDYILPHGYFKTLLPKLGQMQRPYRLQYESKSNLNADKLDVMKQAGLFYAQLGIESLSTPVLQRMRKGVSAIQNIFSLHGLMRRGILPYYNLLFGFPGDQISDYEKMIELLPALYHLQPPGQCIWVQITRFAPLAEKSREYGHSGKLHHHWRYEVLFSDRVEVVDGRYREDPETVVLDLPHAAIMTFMKHGIATRENVVEALGGRFGDERIDMALDDLVRFRFVLAEGPRYVNIVFPESFYRSQDHLDALIGMGYRSEGKRVR